MMAIVMGTARVTIAVVLAVDYSALYSLLNLMNRGTIQDCIQLHSNLSSHNINLIKNL